MFPDFESYIWFLEGNLEAYQRVSSKLKIATVEDEYTSFYSSKSQQGMGETDLAGQVNTGLEICYFA